MARGEGRIYKRGARGILYVDISRHGKRHEVSSRSTSMAVAVRLKLKMIRALESGERVGREIDRLRLGDMLNTVVNDHVLNDRRADRRDRSLRVNLVTHFGADTLAVNVDEAAIGAYMAQRKSAGAANATINKELGFLKRGFRLNRKVLSSIPEIRLLKEAPPREGFVTLEQLERVLTLLPPDVAD